MNNTNPSNPEFSPTDRSEEDIISFIDLLLILARIKSKSMKEIMSSSERSVGENSGFDGLVLFISLYINLGQKKGPRKPEN